MLGMTPGAVTTDTENVLETETVRVLSCYGGLVMVVEHLDPDSGSVVGVHEIIQDTDLRQEILDAVRDAVVDVVEDHSDDCVTAARDEDVIIHGFVELA